MVSKLEGMAKAVFGLFILAILMGRMDLMSLSIPVAIFAYLAHILWAV